ALTGDDRAIVFAAEGTAELEALGDLKSLAWFGDCYTIALILTGEFRRAETVQDHVVEAARRWGDPWSLAGQRVVAARVAQLRGDTETARSHAQAALAS